MPFSSNINIYNIFFKDIEHKYLIVNLFDYNSNKLNNNFKKILFLTEPIKNYEIINKNEGLSHSMSYNDFINNKFDIIVGCINHDIYNKKFKFPLYLFENNFNINDVNIFNNYSDSNDNILNKNFCCLINSWDPNNTRTNIYNKLKTLGNIDCPGKLFNNSSTERLNQIGKINYIKNFKFNICSENFDTNNIDGYITEKLMDACRGGSIPIYSGWFDEIDEKIFNKNRILFYNSNDLNSIEIVFDKIKYLLENNDKLIEFYNKPIFCKNAYNIIEMLKNDFFNNC